MEVGRYLSAKQLNITFLVHFLIVLYGSNLITYICSVKASSSECQEGAEGSYFYFRGVKESHFV